MSDGRSDGGEGEEGIPAAVPAATLIVTRRGPDAPEILMMERAAHMAFAASALVFPGGRIDAGDRALAEQIGGGFEDAAGRIAAIRETVEETGIGVGFAEPPQADVLAALRAGLAAEESFGALLDRFGLGLALDALTPFARWCPKMREPRRFDTFFYLAEAPANAPPPHADGKEAVGAHWASAAELIAECDAGRGRIIFPTRRNLERLAQFGSIEEARADALQRGIHKVEPWIEEREGRQWVCIPEDIGYPVTAELLENVKRG
jgi:8-oxo-dGTP pyrophosphatase MutT (NUDIX family)